MPPQGGPDKSAELNELYSRVTQIAETMGGAAVQRSVRVSMVGAMVAAPRSEDVPALHVDMPDKFRVEFTPFQPLNTPFVLSVTVLRLHFGSPKNGWALYFGPDGWRRTQTPLSDEEIRECLRPEGPRPALY
jgi:hypothetical protein